MNEIHNNSGEKLNCTDIFIYPTYTVSYYVVSTSNMGAYLLRSFDKNEYVSEYKDRVYRASDNRKDFYPVILLERNNDISSLKKKAKDYAECIRRTFEAKQAQPKSEKTEDIYRPRHLMS